MIRAHELRQNNAAEYILYMWQTEDLLRALKFDFTLIEQKLIAGTNDSEDEKEELRQWYRSLMAQMESENIMNHGHLKTIQVRLKELEFFHRLLLEQTDAVKYRQLYQVAQHNINEFRQTKGNQNLGDVEACLTALYGLLVLHLQNKKVTNATGQAMQTFSALMSELSLAFKESEAAL